MVSSVLRLKQFLMELFTLPIYLGPTITVRQWGVMAAICKVLYPCKIFMKKTQTGGEMASKGIFLFQQLCRDIDALSVQGMHTFKNELLHQLHEEMCCFLKFYSYIMACYLNINFKGRLVEPELLSEAKEILLLEMCEAAVAFGDYTLPSAAPEIA